MIKRTRSQLINPFENNNISTLKVFLLLAAMGVSSMIAFGAVIYFILTTLLSF